MKVVSSALIVAALGLMLGCGGGEPASMFGGSEETESVAQALAPDPADSVTSGYCYNNYKWNGTRGRIYYPSNGGCSQSVYSPLVVILHAAGNSPTYSYTDYDYLQRHLARNGFISVSLGVVANTTSTADQLAASETAWDFVEDFMWNTWSKSVYIDPGSVALIGHSRGGDTVRHLAHYLENDPIFDVKAVVSMAATAGDHQLLDRHQTEAYLQLYGTNDGDTHPSGTYPFFDNSGDNGSQFDPAWNTDVLYKSMKLIDGAAHRGYSDLGNVDQQNTVKGYILAYLAAHNKGDVTWYEDYIRGDAIPGSWGHPVFSSYSDGFYRRVIDNFDDGVVPNSTIGGALVTSLATAQIVTDLAPHETDALQVAGNSTWGFVSWSIPVGKRDTDAFEWLSLRLAQLDGLPSNDLRVRIRNGVVWSSELRLSDYGTIAQPTGVCYSQPWSFSCGVEDLVVQNPMATIRVPLAAFGDHNDVRNVQIRFRGDSVGDTFIVDNLEFSEFILKP